MSSSIIYYIAISKGISFIKYLNETNIYQLLEKREKLKKVSKIR